MALKAIILADEQSLLSQGIYPEFGYKEGDEVEVISEGTDLISVKKNGKTGIIVDNDSIKILKYGEKR